MYGAIASLAAIAERDRTGKGQYIDVAMFDSQVSLLSYHAAYYLVSGVAPHRIGNAHPNIVPYQTFVLRDGYVIIAVGNDGQFARLCEFLGVASLATDPRYATNAARVENRVQLIEKLSDLVSRYERSELLSALEERGIPAGPINTVADVLADPQTVHRQMRVDLDATSADGQTVSVPYVRTPIRFSDAELSLRRAAPRLGEHTNEILAELGLAST